MGKIDELIKQYCPDGVEYVNVGDVCDIHKGVQFNKSDMKEMGSYPVMNGGINPSGYAEVFNEDENTITISQGGASAGYVNFLDSKFWLGAHCYALKPYSVVMNRYLYHYIKQNEITLQQCQYGAGIPALAKSTISSLEIPLPPLPVQEAIVNILDRFAVYAAELQAELQARQQQYEYYRDTLLSFEGRDDVQWKKLDEVSTHYTGLTYKPTDVSKSNQGTLVLRSSNIKNERVCFEDNVFVELDSIPNRAIAKPGDILICVRNGSKQLIGKAALIPETPKPMAFGAFMTVLRANSINNKFLFYLWQSFVVKKQLGTDDAMPINQITNREFSKISVPVPSLSEQQRIVDTLDRFDTLTNDLTQGLPAEIEARQQQYEYYRDQLLTFKRKEA